MKKKSDPPVIKQQSVACTVNYNSTVVLEVKAKGDNLTYQWFIVAGAITHPVSHATNPKYQTPHLTDSTSYEVVVSNDGGFATSSIIPITVKPSPHAPVIPTPVAKPTPVVTPPTPTPIVPVTVVTNPVLPVAPTPINPVVTPGSPPVPVLPDNPVNITPSPTIPVPISTPIPIAPPVIAFANLPSKLAVGSTANVSISFQNVNVSDVHSILWETPTQLFVGSVFPLAPTLVGSQFIECEILMMDGTRYFAFGNYFAQTIVTNEIEKYLDITPAVWYKLDSSLVDSAGKALPIILKGNANFDNNTFIWPSRTTGSCLYFNGVGDGATFTVPSTVTSLATTSISIEGMFYFTKFNSNGVGNSTILGAYTNWDNFINIYQDMWAGLQITVPSGIAASTSQLTPSIPLNTWINLRIFVTDSNFNIMVNNNSIFSTPTTPGSLAKWKNNISVSFGQEVMWADELLVKVK